MTALGCVAEKPEHPLLLGQSDEGLLKFDMSKTAATSERRQILSRGGHAIPSSEIINRYGYRSTLCTIFFQPTCMAAREFATKRPAGELTWLIFTYFPRNYRTSG